MSDENISTKIYLETTKNIQMDRKQFQKMMFITNALDEGWSVKKSNDTYIFSKKHENRREYFQEKYLETFVINHMRLE
jgi:hypothetical protein